MASLTPDTDAIAPTTDTPAPAPVSVLKQQSAPTSTVGITLRQARQSKNQSIERVAIHLCIKASFLQALEAGDAQTLPGHVYALGFVRSYAEYLGLDPIETVQDYKREVDDLHHPAELSFPVAAVEQESPGMPVIIILSALLLAGLAVWSISQTKTMLVADGIPTPPSLTNADLRVITSADDRTARPAPPPSSPAPHIATALLDIARAANPAPRTPAPQASAQDLAVPAPTGPIPRPADILPLDVMAAVSEQPTPAAPTLPTPRRRPPPTADVAAPLVKQSAPQGPPASVLSTPDGDTRNATQSAAAQGVSLPRIPPTAAAGLGTPRASRTYGQANRNARIVISAATDIWIQIRDRNQNDLFTRMLRAGDSYRVPNRSDLLLFTGNAGGLKLTIDGKAVAPLGGDGAVRRNIALDPDRLLSRVTSR